MDWPGFTPQAVDNEFACKKRLLSEPLILSYQITSFGPGVN